MRLTNVIGKFERKCLYREIFLSDNNRAPLVAQVARRSNLNSRYRTINGEHDNRSRNGGQAGLSSDLERASPDFHLLSCSTACNYQSSLLKFDIEYAIRNSEEKITLIKGKNIF